MATGIRGLRPPALGFRTILPAENTAIRHLHPEYAPHHCCPGRTVHNHIRIAGDDGPTAACSRVMTPPRTLDDVAEHTIVSTRMLRNIGLSQSTIARRCRPDGPWRRLVPGVVLLTDREPTREQLLHAIHCKLGDDIVITGNDALHAHGIHAPAGDNVRVLLPTDCRTSLPGLMTGERSSYRPEPIRYNGLPFAPPARAAIDAARAEQHPHRIRMFLRAPLYFGACTPGQLRHELATGNQRGTAGPRRELHRFGDAEHITDFGTALQILRTAAIPQPRWRVTLTDRPGNDLGSVDAWWDDVAVGWQFHDTAASCVPQGRQQRQGNNTAPIVVHHSADQLHHEPETVRADIAAAIRLGAGRPRPAVTWSSTARGTHSEHRVDTLPASCQRHSRNLG